MVLLGSLLQAVPFAEVRPKRDLSLVLNEYEIPDPIKLSSEPVVNLEYDYDDCGHMVALTA